MAVCQRKATLLQITEMWLATGKWGISRNWEFQVNGEIKKDSQNVKDLVFWGNTMKNSTDW